MTTPTLPRGLTEADLPPLVVPDPACEGVSPDDVAAEPTPEWDAMVTEHGNPLLAGPDLLEVAR